MEFLTELNKKFKYRKDGDQFGYRDAWYVMKHEPYHGDCEDYSLTLLFNLKDRSLLKMLISLLIRESKILRCTVNGNGHAVLRYKGKYIDNNFKEWTTKKDMKERGGYVFSAWLYIPYQVVVKLVMGFFQTRKRKKI